MVEEIPAYDRLGRRYSLTRRADPSIVSRIKIALGDAESVVNVGAGAGSYEPTDRRVVAVEPSMVMLRQHSVDAAPAICAVAESLPFGAHTFDSAMAVLTIHHWTDARKGTVMRDRNRLDVAPDGFDIAFWRRPHAYLNPEILASMSNFAVMDPTERAAGVRQLANELADGTWVARFGYLLRLDELDLGLRLVTYEI